MGDPFRDQYTAALDRAELLARENDELRSEVARFRERLAASSAAASSPAASPAVAPPDSLKRRVLEQLDALAKELERPAAGVASASAAERDAPAPRPHPPAPMVLADPRVLLPDPATTATLQRSRAASKLHVIGIALVVGVVIGFLAARAFF